LTIWRYCVFSMTDQCGGRARTGQETGRVGLATIAQSMLTPA
jgi:hypothetical protein